jgi:repressor LexA
VPVCPSCGHAFGASKGPLTARQRDVLDFVILRIAAERYAPTLQEIADHFGFKSLATVHEHLSNLVRKGYIDRSYRGEARGIQVTA